jgi:hypothetical protein
MFYRISDARFQEILGAEATTVHRIILSGNTYGEFLYVTVSRPASQGRASITFYGLGFHYHREHWLTKIWFWYENHPRSSVLEEFLPKEAAQKMLQERRTEIQPYLSPSQPSSRARLFEMLADLTDEDAAYAELGDFEDEVGWLPDDFE